MKILEFKEFIGKTLQEVKDEIDQKYIGEGYRYYTSDEWSKLELPKKVYIYYFNFSSLVRNSSGHGYVPCGYWNGSGWYRDGGWLDYSWGAGYRVVLLETSEINEVKKAIETVRKAGHTVILKKNWYITGTGYVMELPESDKAGKRGEFLGSYETKEEAEEVRDVIKSNYGDK